MVSGEVGVDGVIQRAPQVVVIAPGPPWSRGGVERSAGRLLDHLESGGLRWTLVTAFDGAAEDSRCVRLRGRLRGPADRAVFGLMAPHAAVRRQPDFIHVQGAEYGFGIGIALAIDRLPYPGGLARATSAHPTIVVTMHGSLRAAVDAAGRGREHSTMSSSWLAGLGVSFLESRVLRHAAVVVCVADHVAREVAREYGVPRERIRIIPNAIDTEVFVPPPDALARAPEILWVGRATREKALDVVLRVFAEVRAAVPEARLWLVGVQRVRPEPGIVVCDEMDAGALATLYGRVRVLMSTSRYEGDPLVVKEAMSCATPAIVSQAAAASVRDGVDGVVIAGPPDTLPSRQAFVRSTIRLLTDEAQWRRLSAGAVSRRPDFAFDVERRRYQNVYQELLDGRDV